MEAGERDVARLKLLELDPLQRHAHYDLNDVGQLTALWNGVERAAVVAAKVEAPEEGVYPLKASATVKADASKGDSAVMIELQSRMFGSQTRRHPRLVLYEHVLIANAMSLSGVDENQFD